MKIESILAALLEIQKQAQYYISSATVLEDKLNNVSSSVDTLVAMLKKELEDKND